MQLKVGLFIIKLLSMLWSLSQNAVVPLFQLQNEPTITTTSNSPTVMDFHLWSRLVLQIRIHFKREKKLKRSGKEPGTVIPCPLWRDTHLWKQYLSVVLRTWAVKSKLLIHAFLVSYVTHFKSEMTSQWRNNIYILMEIQSWLDHDTMENFNFKKMPLKAILHYFCFLCYFSTVFWTASIKINVGSLLKFSPRKSELKTKKKLKMAMQWVSGVESGLCNREWCHPHKGSFFYCSIFYVYHFLFKTSVKFASMYVMTPWADANSWYFAYQEMGNDVLMHSLTARYLQRRSFVSGRHHSGTKSSLCFTFWVWWEVEVILIFM